MADLVAKDWGADTLTELAHRGQEITRDAVLLQVDVRDLIDEDHLESGLAGAGPGWRS